MADVPVLPPDAASELRPLIAGWHDLWLGRYRYDGARTDSQVTAAPGYSRSFARLIAGLFQRQTPSIVGVPDGAEPPMAANRLADLLTETVAKGAGYGQVLIRPVFDGVMWQPSVVAPTRYAVTWAHRRVQQVIVWDYARDPRKRDDDKAGLVFVETWTPGDGDSPGMVATRVFETSAASGKTEIGRELDTQNPPDALAEHPFIVSAQNDDIARDVFVFVWAWEDVGPVSLWYTNEDVLVGLAKLWDQEQDDAEMTRKRVAMPAELLGRSKVTVEGESTVIARPGFNKHDNILLLGSSMSAEHGPNGGVTPIEFGDDLVQRERIERRENALLEAVGINPASIGRNVGGRSDSASAKRADNQMTMNTITSPARNVEQTLTATVRELVRLRSPLAAVPADLAVAVHEGLKENPAESVDVAKGLRDADAASTETLVRTAHPTWSEMQVADEVARMEAEGAAVAPIEI